MDPKSFFLAFIIFLDDTQKISEWRLVEKKVYVNFKIHKIVILKKIGS